MEKKIQTYTLKLFLDFIAAYSHAYLSSGGPTSRLEEAILHLSEKLNLKSDVYATPTGVFISVLERDQVETRICRIKESGMNLEKLCWLESILTDVIEEKIGLQTGIKVLGSKRLHKPPYTNFQTLIAAFLLGFSLSFPTYRDLLAGVVSGLIAIVTWWISGPGLRNKIPSSIFRDFFGCIVLLSLAGFFEIFFPAPFDAYTMGGVLILVPGLVLTTAIAELADQNLVSGTAKLMQALLTLLALGLATMLFHDATQYFGINASILDAKKPAFSSVASFFGTIISLSSFGVIFRVPIRSLPWATLTGLCGWTVLQLNPDPKYIITFSYLSSLLVGMLSLFLSNRFKVPSQVFSVPGILALLPGVLALSSFQSFALGQGTSGIELGFKGILTAGSIVFGLFSARIPFTFKWRIRRFKVKA